jgi:hypothetical protein
MAKPVVISENAYVVTRSMIPAYIILAVEIIILYFLTSSKVKEQFSRPVIKSGGRDPARQHNNEAGK